MYIDTISIYTEQYLNLVKLGIYIEINLPKVKVLYKTFIDVSIK